MRRSIFPIGLLERSNSERITVTHTLLAKSPQMDHVDVLALKVGRWRHAVKSEQGSLVYDGCLMIDMLYRSS